MKEDIKNYWDEVNNTFSIKDLWIWAQRYGLEDYGIRIVDEDGFKDITEDDLIADLVSEVIEIM